MPRQKRKLTEDQERGYTDQPVLAMLNESEPVPLEYQDGISVRARHKIVTRREKDREAAVQAAKAQARSVNDALRTLAIKAAESGRDLSSFMAGIQRSIESESAKIPR